MVLGSRGNYAFTISQLNNLVAHVAAAVIWSSVPGGWPQSDSATTKCNVGCCNCS